MMILYRAIELPSDEPVQYVGMYVLKWGKVEHPTIGFVEETDLLAERDALRAALEALLKQLKYCESLLSDEYDTSEPSPAEDQARAALDAAEEVT